MKSLLRRPWVRRTLRITVWTVVTLLTLQVVLYGVLQWKGGNAMQHALSRLQAEGETLELRKLLLPPVDERLNLGAIPALQGIAKPKADGEATRRREALASLAIKNEKPLPLHAVMLGELTDLNAWTEASAKVLHLPPNADASTLRGALEKSFPLIAELAAAAKQRPQCEFTPAMLQRDLPANLFALEVPHLSAVMQSSRTICLHSIVCTETGDFDAAVADVRVLSRFATAMQREPMLISLLVSASVQSMALEAVWHLLRSGNLTEAQLQSLQKELATSLEPAALLAIRGELAMAGSTMLYLQSAPSKQLSAMLSGFGNASDSSSHSLSGLLIPRGFISMASAHLIESELDHVVLPMKRDGLRGLLKAANQFETQLNDYRDHPMRHLEAMLTRLAMPSINGIATKVIAIECQRRQAVIACALERWKLQHGAYPATLAELVPGLVGTVENDLIDGQPMRYRTTSDGRYALWCIALDQKDDGGKVTRSPNSNPASDYLKQSYKGDWTWQYQPVK